MTGSLLAASAVTLKVGVVFWVLVAWRTPGGEPWDAPAFWTVVYPIALGIAAVLGACFPRRAWLWGLLLMALQVPVVAVVGSRRIDPTEIRVALPDPPRWRCSTWSAGPVQERAAGAPDVR